MRCRQVTQGAYISFIEIFLNLKTSCAVTTADLLSIMKSFLILPLLAFLAVSCASSTPAKRIEENPKTFNDLSSRHQALVASGKIENGMLGEAVYLAWGDPAAKAEGQEGGKALEKWTYTSIRPVYHQSFYGGGYGYGSRYGRYGRGRGYSPYGSFGTEVSYVPYRSAWVKFRNGRVASWERGQASVGATR